MACRLSNGVLCVLNFLMLILSIPLLASVVWLRSTKSSMCEHSIHGPAVILVLLLMIASFLGIVGSCCRASALLWLYLAGTLVLILATAVFTLWAFAVTNEFAGRIVSGQQVGKYRLGDYSHWLQKHVADEANWQRVRVCLSEAGVCRLWYDSLSSSTVIDVNGLPPNIDPSPVQFGCCQRPPECVISPNNSRILPKSGTSNSTSSDCDTWKEEADKLCYDCNSCKAGVLAEVKRNWHTLSIANTIVLLALVILYSIGCCAFKNNMNENRYHRCRGP